MSQPKQIIYPVSYYNYLKLFFLKIMITSLTLKKNV